jgi:hypothetical protein
LARAVRREARIAIMHHWGVSHGTVRKWRRALGVSRVNVGTHAVTRKIALSRDDDRLERARAKSKRPKGLRKLSKSLKGRVPSAQTLKGALRAAKGPRSAAWKQKMSAYWRRRGHPAGAPGIALLDEAGRRTARYGDGCCGSADHRTVVGSGVLPPGEAARCSVPTPTQAASPQVMNLATSVQP